MRSADRRRETGFGAERVAARDVNKVVGPTAQLVDEISDQIVEPAGVADQAAERLTRNRAGGGEDDGPSI
jgi:hypothetical protein